MNFENTALAAISDFARNVSFATNARYNPFLGGFLIKAISGNIIGLKHSQLKRIERLASRRVPSTRIVTQELARQMSELSFETGRQIGVLINRKGKIEYIMVGDARQIEMPDFKRVRVARDRLRGLRCVHTHLAGEHLNQDDLTDLALLRLDMMSAIVVDSETGLPGDVHSAHLIPAARPLENSESLSLPYRFLDPAPPSLLLVDFEALIASLENELSQTRGAAEKLDERERVILVAVATDRRQNVEASMEELAELADSAGVRVVDSIIQRRKHIHPKTLLGSGKLAELLIRAMQLGADMIVFDAELTPSQVRAISHATEIKVIDRPQLILDIFAQRASSREGKLQVELAQLEYLLPRLGNDSAGAFSRLAGGIGGRGPGETKLETDRRRVRKRIADLEKQVSRLSKQRQERRKNRLQNQVPIISLVGYTNAGKSTLLNTLTKSDVHAERRMFATLDPTSRRLRLPFEREVVINDTVGFIRDLPKTLVAAFRATLEEIGDSDLLLHVVDGSNPSADRQIASVSQILNELDLNDIPTVVVINKSDLAAHEDIEELARKVRLELSLESIAVSALEPKSLDPLVILIGEYVSKDLSVPASRYYAESGLTDAAYEK
ncbi:MAG: GTPase HflX [Pyrinomonadaceae bacterium]